MSKCIKVGVGLILALLLGTVWYMSAADYSYDAISGRHTNQDAGIITILILRADHSFHEELSSSGTTKHAEGHWRRFGESGVALSPEFLKLPSQEASSRGEYYGQIEKEFGIFLSIRFNPDTGDPIFYRNGGGWPRFRL